MEDLIIFKLKTMADENQSYGYGKRPLWQWIVLYVVIGGVIYAFAYYFFFAGKGGESYSNGTDSDANTYQALTGQTAQSAQNTQTAPTQTAPANPTAQTTPPAPAPQPTPPTSAPAPAAVSATIANFAFNPGTITVKKGTTITWQNNDTAPHTVTSDSGAFSSQTLQKGQSYAHTFNTTGTFAYHCTVHPMMHGTVIVTE